MRQLRALLVDWGGVLTVGLDVGMGNWAAQEGLDLAHFRAVMKRWARHPIPAIERGELAVPEFEERLAGELTAASGRPVRADGLLTRMFGFFEHAPAMNSLVWRARKAGLRTGLLSNSWGDHYIRDDWAQMFDAVTISGEVGMRKPDREIYLHAARSLDVQPQECVFVDDLPGNVTAAVRLGMVGIHHRTYDETAVELEALFGIPLAD